MQDLSKIILRSSKINNVNINEAGATEIARRSRGTPRIANRLLRRVRDYAEVKFDGNVSKESASLALDMLNVDGIGLDPVSYTHLTLPTILRV